MNNESLALPLYPFSILNSPFSIISSEIKTTLRQD